MIFTKLKAGALQLTLFIVVVIALLLASFLILVHTHQRFQIQTNFVLETVENADKGITYALQHSMQLNDTLKLDILDEDYKTLNIHKDYWGIFEKVSSQSQIKNRTFQKIALIGASQPTLNRIALYVEDNNKPLVLVGNTIVKGLAFLPQRGVKSGNISGNSYYGSQLIYGNTKTSTALPKLVSETLQQLGRISENATIEEHGFIDLNQSEVFENSFLQPYQLVYSPITIVLSHKTLTGHIIIQSQTEIVVENTSNLKDVILIAPKITVQDGVKGAFQAFATESIDIGSNCYLGYPSALVVTIDGLQPEKQPTIETLELTSPIHIQSDTVVKGAIVFTTNHTATTYEPHVVIDENATVYGEVYCNANLELKGVVYGSVFTSNFIAKQFGSVYQNHLYNATIIVDSLQQEYVGLTFKDSKKDIIKWLY
jgi:hypothetical protein